MNFEYINPHTRLIAENTINVMGGARPDLSAVQPTIALRAPMNLHKACIA